MNIAVDIDDTLTDSFAYLQPFVAAYFGADAAELRRQGISYSNLPPAWRAQETAFGKACYDRVVPDIPFKPGAAAAIARLRALGHHIIIITGRTTDFYTDPYRTTAQQLKNGGIVYDALLCTLDKAAACLAQHIDVLIDDLPQTAPPYRRSASGPCCSTARQTAGRAMACPVYPTGRRRLKPFCSRQRPQAPPAATDLAVFRFAPPPEMAAARYFL